MRIRIIIILSFLFAFVTSIAQVTSQTTSNSIQLPATYAVIVGISKYASDGITQLEYAHRDAQFFADYLKSKAGGSVPEENIRLLLNENATYAAIYDALNWLLETCHKDDLVYFYFSGHGDMENNTIYKLGFLLSFNTPRVNYINNAVRIEDLNNIANTLSITNHAKVVLITDACHSGKLAGSDFRGSLLVGDQLRTVQHSEVRITSCTPDQLSMEDQGWGGGRGVFSYYLINGLEGLADYSLDGVVTVNEIKNYLDSSLAHDALLAQKAQKQTPVINGTDNLRLSSIDSTTLNSLKKGGSLMTSGTGSETFFKPLAVQPQTYLFNLIDKNRIEKIIDFDKLSQLSKEEIPFAFIKMVTSPTSLFDSVKREIDQEKIASVEKNLRNNKDAVERFNNKLAVMLSDIGQTVINQYIDGDEAELERRRYYNADNNGYDVYPKMFALALKVTKPEDYLHRILEIKLHYFSGVAARLKVPKVEDPTKLLDTAMMEQEKALELEKNAAYIQNELGILYDYKKDYATAEKYYLRATQIAPAWVVPWSNLIGVYSNTKNYQKAIEASNQAKKVQPGFQGIYVSAGVVYEKKGNLLMAEELLRKSIKLNSRYYLPFEELGYVYTTSTQYALADSFFYEAEKRKKGFHFLATPYLGKSHPPLINVLPATLCLFDSADVGKNDVLGHFAWAIIANENNNLQIAEREFKKVIALDKANPLAFHYLGKLLYYQKRWEEADIIFNYALNYFLDSAAFSSYYDSLSQKLPNTKSKDCILWKFKASYYSRIDDHYFLATLYQNWNHFAEAEEHYRTIISMSPEFVGGYYKLWLMLESMGRYKDAEEVLKSYRLYDQSIADKELNGFYQRMIGRFPAEAEWYYKGGIFFYRLVFTSPDSYAFDKKKIRPDTNEDVFVRTDVDEVIDDNMRRTSFILPGINERITIAEAIFHPATKGIAFLKKADSLLQDDEAIADINYKIGDLYVWQGLSEKAWPYYKKSVDLKPDNANARLKLVDAYADIYYLQNALEQLDSLNTRHEINFPKQILMAKYCIHSGRFSDASKLLKDAQQIHPYKIPEITDLSGRLQLLSGHPKEALPFYKEYLPGDSTGYLTMYTIARLYAQMKNTDEAWKWLKLSIDKGFNYYWVLKYDETWDSYRQLQQWKNITGKIPQPEVIEIAEKEQ